MILKVIGIKLISIIAGLILLNAAFFAAWFLMLSPMKEDADRELNALTAQIGQLRSKITNIKQEQKYYDENIGTYRTLKTEGYMTDQDRFSLTTLLNKSYKDNRIISMSYDISESGTLRSKDVEKTGHELVKRTITLENIGAFLDTDIFGFINSVNTKFPGHTRLLSVSILRQEPAALSGSLDRIALGTQEAIVTGNISMDWYAMVPLPDETDPNAQQ